jgi:parallel beta-helix repeat protein
MIFYAKDFGMTPDTEIGSKLTKTLCEMAQTDGEKTLVFEKGVYHIDIDNCEEKTLYITNTVGDNEFSDGEVPHKSKVAMYFGNIKNLTVEGNGSTFLVDGHCTNIALENCENITLDGIELDTVNPPLHEFTVEEVKGHSVVFSLNKSCKYVEKNGKYYLFGKGYQHRFYEKGTFSSPALVRANDLDHTERVRHPFAAALSFKEIGAYKFRLTYLSARRFEKGDKYYIFDTRRDNVGIFVNSCKNFTLKNSAQRYNCSLALVCQKTENITVDNVDFSPKPDSGRLICSLADFMQICNCKGQVSVTNSNFCGACDDAINVHGIHMYVDKVEGNTLTLKFRHPQTHGFNPFFDGDEIEYVDRFTLECRGKAKILSSRLVSEHIVEILVDSTDGVGEGMAVEDITLCPDFYYAGNTVNRITTRGILVTTRGKVVIENNEFRNTHMAAILLSDDAKSWYESGPCKDVTIKNNSFGECLAHFISVLPENGANTNPVHKNITIEGNTFDSKHDKGIHLKCAENVTIRNNKIISSAKKKDFVKAVNCQNLVNEQ